METLELLEDIQQARAQAERGETVPHDQALEYLISVLLTQVQPGDGALIMTNGSFGGLHDRLLHSLRESE